MVRAAVGRPASPLVVCCACCPASPPRYLARARPHRPKFSPPAAGWPVCTGLWVGMNVGGTVRAGRWVGGALVVASRARRRAHARPRCRTSRATGRPHLPRCLRQYHRRWRRRLQHLLLRDGLGNKNVSRVVFDDDVFIMMHFTAGCAGTGGNITTEGHAARHVARRAAATGRLWLGDWPAAARLLCFSRSSMSLDVLS